MKQQLCMIFLSVCVSLTSCKSYQLPPFSVQRWHVDRYSGHALSTAGLELAFGSEWMVTDTSLIQTSEQVADYPKLSSYLAEGISKFPEIAVDSVLFYNPHRGLLFVTYHQVKPLKPTSEISIYKDLTGLYSTEYAGIFGNATTHIDDSGWENGPSDSVYSNVRYSLRDKRMVLLQRIPGDPGIAVFQICVTIPKRGKWWEEYPRGTFWNIDLGNLENIEQISYFLQSSRTLAVSNLKLVLANVKSESNN